MSKRGISIIEQISLMSLKIKIMIIAVVVTIVLAIGTGTYISLARTNEDVENIVEEEVSDNTVENVVANDIELIENEVENNTVQNEVSNNTVKEENVVIKEVTYKGKKVEVPKAEVAPTNSKEDAQVKKTGGEAISAEEAATKFENDGQSSGIDVSAHQGNIDWAQVKASGVEFAMLRCGFRGYTEGKIYEDACFKANIKGAVNNGIMVGIYFYSVATNEEEALQEAAWVVERIKSYRITYPVAYDFEDFNRGRTSGISGAQATSNAITFLNYVSSNGYTPMMYANKNDISSNFDKGRLGSYKFWLAHYTSSTDYTGKYQMWQYTSKGSVPGISGSVDMNVAYFRYGAVAEPKHTHDFENGTIIKTPESKPATCTEAGVQFKRCKDCSESQREEIPALGGHKFGNFKTTKAPTEKEEGEKTRECTVCHEKETVKIEKLKPTTSNTGNNTKPNNNPNNNTNKPNSNTNKPDSNTNKPNNNNTNSNANNNANNNANGNTNGNPADDANQNKPTNNTNKPTDNINNNTDNNANNNTNNNPTDDTNQNKPTNNTNKPTDNINNNTDNNANGNTNGNPAESANQNNPADNINNNANPKNDV